jgi:hypothetical protein
MTLAPCPCRTSRAPVLRRMGSAARTVRYCCPGCGRSAPNGRDVLAAADQWNRTVAAADVHA